MSENENKNAALPTVIQIPAIASGKFEIEHPEERSARLSRQALEARDLRIREQVKYFALLGGYLIALFAFGYMSLFGSQPSTVEWARGILNYMVVGLVGFMLRNGRSSGPHCGG
jgi:hypothetical protein